MITEINKLKALRLNNRGWKLKFDLQTETNFVSWAKAEQHSMAKAAIVVIALSWLVFLCADFFRLTHHEYLYWDIPLFPLVIGLRSFVAIVVISVLLFLIKRKPDYFPWLVLLTYLFVAFTTSIISNIYEVSTEYKSAFFPLILIVPLFILPIGILLRHATIGGLAMSIFFVVSQKLMLDPNTLGFQKLFTLAVIISIFAGFSSGYYREKTLRSAFLAIKELELTSYVDPLTQLGNRRYFEKIGGRLFNQTKRHAHALSVAIIDIDHFKKINDYQGHEAGDEVLRAFAKHLDSTLKRPLDLAIRIGGEEFIIMFPQTNINTAAAHIKQLQKDVEEHVNIQFSAGLTSAENITTLDDMYKKADDLLYDAKRKGRNCICAAA